MERQNVGHKERTARKNSGDRLKQQKIFLHLGKIFILLTPEKR